MTERRTCKHVAAKKPPSLSSPIASIHLLSTREDDPCDVIFELCVMCAGFYFQALLSSEERGAVPVPIDKVDTTGLV